MVNVSCFPFPDKYGDLPIHVQSAYVFIGSQSSTISLWPMSDTESKQPAHTLIGHKHNVCALDSSDSGLIVSGSWDK
jgi:phospholipase A-2-activating protein